MLYTIGFHWLAIVLYINNLFRDLGCKKQKNSYNNFDVVIIFCSLLHITAKTHYLLISYVCLMVIVMIDIIWLKKSAHYWFQNMGKESMIKKCSKSALPCNEAWYLLIPKLHMDVHYQFQSFLVKQPCLR